jgi:uncharacterized protein with PQ loop repeat
VRELVANVAVVAATLLTWVSLIPQLVKLARTGDPEGVSATWPAIGLVSNVAWVVYLSGRGLWAAVPAAVVMALFYGLVIRALALAGKPIRAAVIRGLLWSVGVTGLTVGAGWDGLGAGLVWSYAVQVAPAVYGVYRSSAPTGVSAGTWWIVTAEAALWGVYGWLLADLPIVAYAVVGITSGAVILIRLAAHRRRPAFQVP